MGCAPHSRRAAEARDRGRAVDGRQVHGQASARRVRSGQTWKTFLRNHAAGLGAIDFLVVPTINFRLLSVLVILRHERRRLISLSVTDYRTAEWIARQITEAFPWDEAPSDLIRDRDSRCGQTMQIPRSAAKPRPHQAAL